jgi:hypothetical protein
MKTLNYSNSSALNTKVSNNGYNTIIKMTDSKFFVELDDDGNGNDAVYSENGDYVGKLKNGRFYKAY